MPSYLDESMSEYMERVKKEKEKERMSFTRDELDLACRHAVDEFKRLNLLFTAKELQEACAASARRALDQVSKSTPLPQLVVFQPVEQTGDPREPKESRLDWAKKRTEPVARVCPWISVGYDDQTEPP